MGVSFLFVFLIEFFKLGSVGLRPKCKMQNSKCKIRERETG